MTSSTTLDPAYDVSVPSEALIDQVASWGNVLVLGAGGKIGSGLSTMLARAFASAGNDAQAIAVSRWTDASARQMLTASGVTTLVADVSDPVALAALPNVDRVIFLVGTKFGTASQPDEAWMTNVVLPAAVAARFRGARIAVLSSGNVYPFTSPMRGGPDETVEPAPIGEYGITCLGRERVFQNAARRHGTSVTLLRLNYACEPRYGVIADIARKVRDGSPVDVSVGVVNVVGQRYVNEVIIRSVDHAASPAFLLNLTGPETASVRWIAEQLGKGLDTEPELVGTEGSTSLLSNAARCHGLFGYPDTTLTQLIDQEVAWIRNGGELWSKPTKFERTDGRF